MAVGDHSHPILLYIYVCVCVYGGQSKLLLHFKANEYLCGEFHQNFISKDI